LKRIQLNMGKYLIVQTSFFIALILLSGSGQIAAQSAESTNLTQPAAETPMMRGLGVGTHFGRKPNWDVDKVLPLLKEMGVSVIRDGPEWATVEKTKGHYEIPPDDQYWFDKVTQSGIRVVLVLMRRNDIYENPLDPDAFARWAAYMARTWKSPQVLAYEIWNEPPNFDFPELYGKDSDWIQKYSEMVRKATDAIHKVNPNATVLHNLEEQQWFTALEKYSSDYAHVDGMDLHPYPMRVPAEGSPDAPPITDADHSLVSYLTISAIDYSKKYLGHPLPMYVGEYGFPVIKGERNGWKGVTETAQAAYEVRGMLQGLHYGVKLWCFYDMVNDGTDPKEEEDNFGLVRNIDQNYEPKPAFYSLQRVARLMGADWQIDTRARATLDTTPASAMVVNASLVRGPQMFWFRVGKDYITYVWKAGEYEGPTSAVTGAIIWSNAPRLARVEVQDLVTGKEVPATLSGAKGKVTLSGVPVGSNPIAIRWVAK